MRRQEEILREVGECVGNGVCKNRGDCSWEGTAGEEGGTLQGRTLLARGEMITEWQQECMKTPQ